MYSSDTATGLSWREAEVELKTVLQRKLKGLELGDKEDILLHQRMPAKDCDCTQVHLSPDSAAFLVLGDSKSGSHKPEKAPNHS